VQCSFGFGLDHEALTSASEMASASRFRSHLTVRCPLLPYGYGYTVEHPLQDRLKPSFVIEWVSECPDLKNYKWRLFF